MDVIFADTDQKELNQKFPQLMEMLDEKSKALFWHIWTKRYAQIRELSNLIKAPTDIYTLSRLKEVINAQSTKILGKNILRFEESKIDPLTGDKVLFSWWLNEECFDIRENHKELVDIFDEPNRLRIIIKLPVAPVTEEELQLSLEKNNLVVSTSNYQKKIPLFYNVKDNIKKTYKNGILEVILEKV